MCPSPAALASWGLIGEMDVEKSTETREHHRLGLAAMARPLESEGCATRHWSLPGRLRNTFQRPSARAEI